MALISSRPLAHCWRTAGSGGRLGPDILKGWGSGDKLRAFYISWARRGLVN